MPDGGEQAVMVEPTAPAQGWYFDARTLGHDLCRQITSAL
jgi:hypothetical protein